MKRKLQIGVMGSAADLNYSDNIEAIAYDLGKEIALAGHHLVFGAEKDLSSLSTVAHRGAKEHGGLTIGVTYDKEKETFEQPDIVIPTGMGRGGGREYVLVLSCDLIITVGGGSGTLNEMTVAYQAGIPIISIVGTGGWSDKLADQFIDQRQRMKVLSVKTASEAVKNIPKLIGQ